MARHKAPSRATSSTARRVALAVTTAGLALGAGATTASAADVVNSRPTSLGSIDPQSGVEAVTTSLGYVTGPVAGLKPNPLAGTGVDPLDNGVGTQLSDFQPLSSKMLTGPVLQAPSVGSIPVVGQVLGG